MQYLKKLISNLLGIYLFCLSSTVSADFGSDDVVKNLMKQARLYLKTKDYEQALESYNQALNLQADDFKILIARANAYWLAGQIDNATSDLDRLIQISTVPAEKHKLRIK